MYREFPLILTTAADPENQRGDEGMRESGDRRTAALATDLKHSQ